MSFIFILILYWRYLSYLSCIIIYIFLYNINYLYILYYLDKFLKKCLTFLENKKREGIKCANEEPASVFLNARSRNTWRNAKCVRCTFMKELVPVLAAVAVVKVVANDAT
jgi:hypothetical protein